MPSEFELFLGKPITYWLELNRKMEDLQLDKLIMEMATLRAKVSFYESRINEMEKFMRIKLEVK